MRHPPPSPPHHDELRSPVLCAAFGGGVVGPGHGVAVAAGGEARGIDAALDKVGHHDVGPTPRTFGAEVRVAPYGVHIGATVCVDHVVRKRSSRW